MSDAELLELVQRRDELREWVAALRSGAFTPGTGTLVRVERLSNGEVIQRHCCLGVKCELDVRAGRRGLRRLRPFDDGRDVGFRWDDPAREVSDLDDAFTQVIEFDQLPEHVAEALGLNEVGVLALAALAPELRTRMCDALGWPHEDPGAGRGEPGGDDRRLVDLTIMNDNGASFALIADVIEAVWLAPLAERLAELQGGRVASDE